MSASFVPSKHESICVFVFVFFLLMVNRQRTNTRRMIGVDRMQLVFTSYLLGTQG